MSPSVQTAVAVVPANGITHSEELLAGIIRAHPGTSEADQLLEYFGRDPKQMTGWPAPVLDGFVQPLDIKLSPNALQVIVRAGKRAYEANRFGDSRIHIPHLFGAILELEGTVAYRKLSEALEGRVDLARVRDGYREYLLSP